MENQIKVTTETIAQLELQSRDESAIENIKSTNFAHIGKIAGEIQESIREVLQTSNPFLNIEFAMNEMAECRMELIESIIKI